ncbi:response regulator [Salinimicrobium xinjiangense]|uniref:response regulator n=1 Tax=Salinimicrobium xinjiangense TaxID=438596 RepID=UPI00041A93E1|nr:response regulator [Salinimicrobium xinjiangense]
MKAFNVVIVDDHPLITDSYKTAIEKIFSSGDIITNVTIHNNLDSALDDFKNSTVFSEADLIFLDIQLPPSKDDKVFSGEDLGVKIRKNELSAKIVISTSLNDNFRIHGLLKSINPEGFLIKNDINKTELLIAIDKVIHTPPYYSHTVLQLMRDQVSSDIVLDANDRKILFELSIGTKLKDCKR